MDRMDPISSYRNTQKVNSSNNISDKERKRKKQKEKERRDKKNSDDGKNGGIDFYV